MLPIDANNTLKMKDRIKQLMEAQHMTQANFAALLGLNPATLSQLLTGKANPSLNHVEAIRKGFPNISYEWLIAGVGPMFKVEASQAAKVKEQGLFNDDGESNVVTQIPQIAIPVTAPEPKKQNIYEPKPSVYESHKPQDEPARRVKEIVLYYTDHTFETFVPKG